MNQRIDEQRERELIQYLNSFLLERENGRFIAYRNKTLTALTEANAFYAKILFDIALSLEPTLHQFSDMMFSEEAEVIYQNALYLYKKWKEEGLSGAIVSYCHHMNRLMARVRGGDGARCEKTNLRRHEKDILLAIKGIEEKCKKLALTC